MELLLLLLLRLTVSLGKSFANVILIAACLSGETAVDN